MRKIGIGMMVSLLGLAACATGTSVGEGTSASASTGAASATAEPSMPGGTATSRSGGAQGSGPPRAPATPNYLSGDTSKFYLLMPPAPKNGDARDRADRRIFRDTRALKGTPRWQMAIEDAELGTGAMLKHFACSIGVEATPEQLPKVVSLLNKASRDAARSVGPAKEFYARKRPFLVDKGPTCVPEATIGKSFDYPSGHTTMGWAWALTLAQVDPARAEPILARGRAVGDSRVVCGMHNASAVEAARFITSSAMAVVTASPAYQADLAAAREELAQAQGRLPKPDPAHCALEAELVKAFW